jgi:hypothetical protein
MNLPLERLLKKARNMKTEYQAAKKILYDKLREMHLRGVPVKVRSVGKDGWIIRVDSDEDLRQVIKDSRIQPEAHDIGKGIQIITVSRVFTETWISSRFDLAAVEDWVEPIHAFDTGYEPEENDHENGRD